MKKLLSGALLIVTMWGCSKNDKQTTSVYKINETVSKAEWKGSAPDHFHVGSFKVTGSLTSTKTGGITGGDFIIPISSIEDYDLPDPVKKTLLDDLLSANFFNLALHPTASFHITRAEAYATTDTNAVADANYILTGDFNMVGQTHNVSFPFKVTTNTDSLTAEAKFKIDRTKWGMNIYSDPSKALYILPDVNIHLNLKASANQ